MPGLGVEAVGSGIVGRALSVAVAASLRASVAIATDSLLGDIAAGVATGQAQTGEGHDGQLVRLGLCGSIGSAGQNGDGRCDSEKHDD